ncbi:unnamed protein product [Parajaminaea phylloscopi]
MPNSDHLGLLFSLPHRPLDDDGLPSSTFDEESKVEEDVFEVLSPYTTVSLDAIPAIRLRRSAHIAFLSKLVFKPLPAEWVAFDALRPWLLYWSLHSFALLGHAVEDALKVRIASTLLSCQNKQVGGFGGSPGQIPHLMPTYAAVNALAMVGGPGSLPSPAECKSVQAGKLQWASLGKGGWDEIDRAKLYAWIMRLKQPDGSFTVHEGGEVDVRATFCVWCIATLTGIMTEELLQGMRGFLVSCQSYEGGLASTSFPAYTSKLELNPTQPRPALGEAHGGYAFCATAAYLGIRLLQDDLFDSSSKGNGSVDRGQSLDLKSLTRWVLGLQCPFPSQGGGYKGRINKLVDGCYSWFSGSGMWGVLEPLLDLDGRRAAGNDLWDREALQLYILLVAQRPPAEASQNGADDGDDNASYGGLRDKPGKRPDAYHTCYNLAGLSGAQHVVRPCFETRRTCYKAWQPRAGLKEKDQELSRRVFSSMLGFNLAPGREKLVVGNDTGSRNEVLPTHPILNLGFVQARAMMLWAYGQKA